MNYEAFQLIVWKYYDSHKRTMPWRENTDPYWVMVSEVMLQQTQVERVEKKFAEFIMRFPDVQHLASAPFSAVLDVWLGLGYNRRARYLHQAAKQLVESHGGVVPSDTTSLIKLPGIGPNTAAAIQVYAFNQPSVFIETNIRSVIIHHFFQDRHDVADSEVVEVVAAVQDTRNPREWYWALMDYGTHLKRTATNPSRRSRHHITQQAFKGSIRQLRGHVLRELARHAQSFDTLQSTIDDERLPEAVDSLLSEGFILDTNGMLHIAS